jgi:hypothetical protein
MIEVIKLVTGEEIVGDTKYEQNKVIVKKPCAVMLVNSKSTPDQHSMALIPYAGYTKDHIIHIDKRSIVWNAELQDDVYNQYNAIFGTGIQIVSGDVPMPRTIPKAP